MWSRLGQVVVRWGGGGERTIDRLTAWVLGALLTAGTIWFFTIDSGFGFRGPRVDGDGIYFWLNLRSLVMDRDVDFSNDYAAYGNPWNYGETSRGMPMNPATVGSALMWAPFYLPARGVVALLASQGVAVRSDGTSHAEQLAAFYGSFLYGFFALLLALKLCRRHFPRGPSLLGAVATAVGGNLVFYMVVQPSYSHAPAAFALAAFVERWDATRQNRTLRGWIVLGALGGLAMLVRPQLVVVAVLPLCDLVRQALSCWRQAERPRADLWRLMRNAAVGGSAALVAFAPQMVIWCAIHGRPFAIPQGRTFMQWGSPLWLEVLFHPRAGLVPWMPLALPALIGLGLLVHRRRQLGLPLVLLLLLMVYVNAASWDWWAGYSYGARRFTALYVLLALGLAAFLDLLRRWVEQRPRAFIAAVAVAVLGGFCLLNLSMINNRRHRTIDWYKHREFYKVYVGGVEHLAHAGHRVVGNPLSWPANLAFAARYGVSPGRYDEVVGRYFLDEKHGVVHRGWKQKTRDDLSLTARWMKPFLDRGFGHVQTQAGRQAVLVLKRRACVLLPLIQRPKVRLELSGGSLVPTGLTVRLNGETLGTHRLTRPWQTMVHEIAPRRLRRGVNELCLDHEPDAPGPAASSRSAPQGREDRGPAAPRRVIGKTQAVSPVDLAAFSTGASGGGRVELWVDGRRVGTEQRGLNVVAVDPEHGEVVSASGFDLAYWPQGGELLARWVAGLPPGTIVVLAVGTDAARLFKKPALEALNALGATTDLHRHSRQGYAAVGVKGARPGSALEVVSASGPAVVAVGRKPLAWTGVAHYDRLKLVVTEPMAWR